MNRTAVPTTTTAKSLFLSMMSVFVGSYFLLTLLPDLPGVRKYTKPEPNQCVSPVNCAGLAFIMALFSPLFFVLFRTFFKSTGAANKTP